jgi:hypothetical protein
LALRLSLPNDVGNDKYLILKSWINIFHSKSHR